MFLLYKMYKMLTMVIRLITVTMFLSLPSVLTHSDTVYTSSLSSLTSPSKCQMKLICVITQAGDNQLQTSQFMQGISVLTMSSLPGAVELQQAVRIGQDNLNNKREKTDAKQIQTNKKQKCTNACSRGGALNLGQADMGCLTMLCINCFSVIESTGKGSKCCLHTLATVCVGG